MLGLIRAPYVIRVLCVLGISRTSHIRFLDFSVQPGSSSVLSRMDVGRPTSIPPSSRGGVRC